MSTNSQKSFGLLLIFLFTIGNYAQVRNSQAAPDEEPVSHYFESDSTTKLKWAKRMEFEFLGEHTNRLLPPEKYRTKFADLLKNKKTHLARIYPDKNCFTEKVISLNNSSNCQNAIPFLGDGSFYSFRLRVNFNQRFRAGTSVKAEWADIQFDKDKILAGSATVQGIISEISGKNFENISENSEEIKFLRAYKEQRKLLEIENQKAVLKNGIQFNNNIYKDSATAKLNSLYVIRSIAYRNFYASQKFSAAERRFISRTVDSIDLRTDIIVAFKIVGREEDGSLIILWKELRQKDAAVIKN